jgi:hypothetical protein
VKKTCLEKYGFDNVSKNSKIVDKIKEKLINDIDLLIEIEEDESGEETETGDSESEGKPKNAPSLSDIQLISNEVVYDATNNPSVKIVFKVKNSSGVNLKAVNVRVEKK